jgi:hypothetical protein
MDATSERFGLTESQQRRLIRRGGHTGTYRGFGEWGVQWGWSCCHLPDEYAECPNSPTKGGRKVEQDMGRKAEQDMIAEYARPEAVGTAADSKEAEEAPPSALVVQRMQPVVALPSSRIDLLLAELQQSEQDDTRMMHTPTPYAMQAYLEKQAAEPIEEAKEGAKEEASSARQRYWQERQRQREREWARVHGVGRVGGVGGQRRSGCTRVSRWCCTDLSSVSTRVPRGQWMVTYPARAAPYQQHGRPPAPAVRPTRPRAGITGRSRNQW